MVAVILLITLNISMASDWILKWWTVKELSLSRSSWNDEIWSLQIILRAFSCNRLILLLLFRLWNIQFREQYLNWDSKKAFTNVLFWWKVKWQEILARADNFIFALVHKREICLSNSRWLSIVIPSSLTELLSHIKSVPISAHICSDLWPATSKCS